MKRSKDRWQASAYSVWRTRSVVFLALNKRKTEVCSSISKEGRKKLKGEERRLSASSG